MNEFRSVTLFRLSLQFNPGRKEEGHIGSGADHPTCLFPFFTVKE